MFDVQAARKQFPALARTQDGRPVAYFDGPGGTQVPAAVIEAMTRVLEEGVSNLGGDFASSRFAHEITESARRAIADMFGAASPEEIVFGKNMTSLTFSVSRALARTWRPGDRIVVTSLDHDANVTPWRLAAADRGVAVDMARFDSDTYRLEVESVERVLTTYCSWPSPTPHALDIPDVAGIVEAPGALVYDAVHYAPHSDRRPGHRRRPSSLRLQVPRSPPPSRASRALELEAYRFVPLTPAPKWETGTSFGSLAGWRRPGLPGFAGRAKTAGPGSSTPTPPSSGT